MERYSTFEDKWEIIQCYFREDLDNYSLCKYSYDEVIILYGDKLYKSLLFNGRFNSFIELNL